MHQIRLYILERTQSEIHGFRYPHFRDEDHISSDDFERLVEFWYEVGFKSGWLKSKHVTFSGHPDREEGIKDILDEALSHANKYLGELLNIVLKEWVDGHDGSKPETWAIARISGYFDDLDDHDFMQQIIEPPRGTPQHTKDGTLIGLISAYIDKMPECKKQLTLAMEEDEQMFKDENEGEESPYSNLHEYIENLDLETITAILSNIHYREDKDVPTWRMELMSTIGLASWRTRVDHVVDGGSPQIDRLVVVNKKISHELDHLSSKSPIEQYAIVNEALHAIHGTDAMTTYFADKYNVEKDFFDDMENKPTDEWQKELKDIGFDW